MDGAGTGGGRDDGGVEGGTLVLWISIEMLLVCIYPVIENFGFNTRLRLTTDIEKSWFTGERLPLRRKSHHYTPFRGQSTVNSSLLPTAARQQPNYDFPGQSLFELSHLATSTLEGSISTVDLRGHRD